MITGFAIAIAGCSVGAAIWSFIAALRHQPPAKSLLGALAFVELLLLIQLIIGVVLLLIDTPPAAVTFIAYLIGVVLVLPAGAVWALAERSRSSTVILGIVCLAVPVMIFRLHEVWGGASA